MENDMARFNGYTPADDTLLGSTDSALVEVIY